MKKIILLLAMGAALTTQTLFAQVPSYVPTNGLVGYWPFSGNPNDVSVNGNNGINNGATLTTDRFGNSNSAYSFDGISNNVKILHPVLSENPCDGDWTISFWFKLGSPLNNLNNFVIFSNVGGPNEINPFGYYDGTGSNFVGYWWTRKLVSTLQANFDSNIWYNFIYTYTGSTNSIEVYINGVNNSGNTTDMTGFGGSAINLGSWYVGSSSNPAGFFNGKIDDIGIWNRTLTQQEITNLYNSNQCFNLITVTDTLIINVGQLSYTNPIAYANNIIIAPNPASTQINISFNNVTNLNGGTLKIINSLGQEVATTPITTSGTNSTMQLATWGGTGMYFVQIINPQGQIVDIKKIILQ